MAEEALAAVTLRNQFYRDGQRKLIVILLISLAVNAGLVTMLSYIVTHPPAPKYFATSLNGRITPIFPLNVPNQSDTSVLQWANEAAIAAYSYNFVNYIPELEAASGFFTDTGWDNFVQSLKTSNNLDAVKKKKMVVSAAATAAPNLVKKGQLSDGTFAWTVQMPLHVIYQSSTEFAEQNIVLTMLIVRVPTVNAPFGIGIAQFVASTDTSSGGD